MQTTTVRLSPYAKKCAWCKGYWVPKRQTAQTCSPKCRNALWKWRNRKPRQHNGNVRKIQESTYGAFYILIPHEIMQKAGLKKGDTIRWFASWNRIDAIKVKR